MSNSSVRVFLLAAFLVIGGAVAAAQVAMVMATQHTAPARLVRIALEQPNVLTGAQLRNDSGKPIASYRIGWANIYPNGLQLRRANLISVRKGVKPGDIQDVPSQAIGFDEGSQNVMFFVAEVTYADGSNWQVDLKDIAPEAGFQFAQ